MDTNTQSSLPPFASVAYLVVTGQQNPEILNEFLHSLTSLRRHHPSVPVLVYHQNLTPEQIAFFRRLNGVIDFPIAIDSTGRFAQHGYVMKNGLSFPELRVLAAKIDVLLLTPGDTLFLDTDTEVRAPLDEVFESRTPWMHRSEGPMAEHDRDLKSIFAAINWGAYGWRGDPQRTRMFNSGSIWIPEEFKVHLYKAKELLWSMLALPAQERGDNRLDEQLAVSIALEEATGSTVREVSPRVYHYWLERYENDPPWYEQRFRPADATSQGTASPNTVLIPPPEHDPAVAPLLT